MRPEFREWVQEKGGLVEMRRGAYAVLVVGVLLAAMSVALCGADYLEATLVRHLPNPLESMAGVVLGSKVYLIGGGYRSGPGTPWNASHDIIEIDPDDWSSTVVGEFPFKTGSWAPHAAAAGGKIYVLTFGNLVSGYSSGLYEIDPSDWEVTYRADFPADNVMLLSDMASLDGKLYIAGGYNVSAQHDQVWEFNPATGDVRVVGTLPEPSYFVSLVTLGNKLYALGGYQANADSLDYIVEINPSMSTVREIGRLPHPSGNNAAVLAIPPDRIYLIGGSRSEDGGEVEWFPDTAIETTIQPGGTVSPRVLPVRWVPGIRWAYAGYVNGKAFHMGGDIGDGSSSDEVRELKLVHDTTPPALIQDFTASDGKDDQSTLTWTNPSDSDLYQIIVKRKTTGYPSGHTDGDTRITLDAATPGREETFVEGGLTNGQIYYYAVFSCDTASHWNNQVVEGKNADIGKPGLENHPPETVIVVASISGNTATFTWSGSDDTTPATELTYSYRLVRPGPAYDSWSTWSSGKTKKYTDLSPGNYKFQVRARDAEMAIDPSPASEDFAIAEEPLNCIVHLRPQGMEASIGVIGDFEVFDIYVGASVGVIDEVRFSSDESSDGEPTGEWTDWFYWSSNALFSPWDAAAKTMVWSFATGGSKEVWAEIRRNGGSSADSKSINVSIPIWRRFIKPGDILYDPCGAIWNLGHIGIYLGNGLTADPQLEECVHSIRTWDYPARNKVQLLRVQCSEEEADAAAEWARVLVDRMGDSYSYQIPGVRAAAAVLAASQGVPYLGEPEKDPGQDETEWYCSELAWAAYFNVGIDIEVFPGNLSTGMFYNPNLPISPNEICEDEDVYPIGAHSNGDLVYVQKGRCDCSEHGAIRATCPVDLVVTDPDGLIVSKNENEISGATYWMDDFDADGSIDVLVVFGLKEGIYQIEVIPRPDAKPTDKFTLVFEDHGTGQEVVLADEALIEDIPDTPYKIDIAGAGESPVVNQPPEISVLSPGEGEVISSSSFQVQWQATDSDNPASSLSIDLFYSTNSGATWTSISSNEVNGGVYDWDISKLQGGEYWLKVIAEDPEGGTSEATVGPFTISTFEGQIIVAPNPATDAGVVFFYTLPEGTSTAKLMVLNVAGRLLFENPLDADSTRFPSAGMWNPVDQDGIPLANGPYVYVLIAHSKVIGQGKMVIQR